MQATLGSGLLAAAIGIAASIVGGAIGGVVVGGKAIGNEVAAMMGGFFGPLAGASGVLIGLILIAILH